DTTIESTTAGIDLGEVANTANLNLTSAAQVNLHSNLTATGDLTIAAATDTFVADNVVVSGAGDLTSTSGVNFLMGQSSQLLVGGDSRISAANIAVEENAIITSQDLSLK